MTERNAEFQHLVLQLLWLILLTVLGGRPVVQARNLRSNLLAWVDEHGNQSEMAAAYRRESTYPELLPPSPPPHSR